MTLALEVRTLEAVVDALGLDALRPARRLLRRRVAAVYAARHPGRVGRLVCFGAYARGADVAPAAVRDSVLGLVRAHWGLGSRVLSEVWLPGADADERAELTEYQRSAADAGDGRRAARAGLLDRRAREPRGDSGCRCSCCTGAATAPRRSQLGRASWRRSSRARACCRSTAARTRRGTGTPPPSSRPRSRSSPAATTGRGGRARRGRELSAREREVLRLVASGLSDAQIAAALVLSPHTVHRHVANIRAKLRQPTRAAAAAEAARLGVSGVASACRAERSRGTRSPRARGGGRPRSR